MRHAKIRKICEFPAEDNIIEDIASGLRSIRHTFDGNMIRVNKSRFLCFKRSRKCVVCGIEGNIIVLENNINNYYYTLYHKGAIGNYILMTIDHKIPKSLGGKDKQSNLATMCENCNILKGNNKISYGEMRNKIGVNKFGETYYKCC